MDLWIIIQRAFCLQKRPYKLKRGKKNSRRLRDDYEKKRLCEMVS